MIFKRGFSQPYALPLFFVLLYGSGFVGAKLGLPHAGPFTFLTLRFGLAALIMLFIAKATHAPWPTTPLEWVNIAVAGLLGVGLFSVSAYASIDRGVSPAISALIIALTPIVVAVAAGRLLGERTNSRQVIGLAVGLWGVYLVLFKRLSIDPEYWGPISLSGLALIGLAAGNLYQKRFCSGMNLFTGGTIQCGVCCVATWVGSMLSSEKPIELVPQFFLAWFWTSIAVSIGAVSILYVMIRRAEVSRVASVYFMMPVSAAILSYLLFGQTLDTFALAGILVTSVGVFLAMK